MSGTQDPLTVALTGQLPFVIVLGAAIAFPLSLLLVRLYRRAVLRSMRSRGTTAAPTEPSAQAVSTPTSPLELSLAEGPSALPASPPVEALFHEAERAPWRAALIYGMAGTAYALVMTFGLFIAERVKFSPERFVWLFWTFAWPAVLTTNLVAGSTRRRKFLLVAAYIAVLGVLAAIALARSPKLTAGQLALHWLLTNGPGTLLLLAFLTRPIRAVGPMVITFMIIAVMGSQLGLDFVNSDQRILRFVAGMGFRIGLSGTAVFYSLILVGFVLFGFAGWAALGWIRRKYVRKQISDQSLTVDAIWLLFGIVQSIDLVFERWWWIFTGLAAFVLFKAVTRIGFRFARQRVSHDTFSPKLLLLRVFSLGKRSERLFDALGKHWLRVGSVRLIAGPDLASSTVEPHEFLDFLIGKLARRFIDGPKTLDVRLSELDTRPDWDGRFRVTDFFCHDDTWKMVLARLIGESDAVLMDLRGFSKGNAGCKYEIEELLNVAPLERLVFVIDNTTDATLLEQVAAEGWSRLRADSPNLQLPSARLRLFRFTGSRSGELRHLLRLLSSASAPEIHA